MFSQESKKQDDIIIQTLKAYQAAVNEAAIVSITDLSGKILYVNQKFTEISKYTAAELIGKTHNIINSGHHTDTFFKEMWLSISSGKHWRAEIKNKAKDGSYYWVDTVITPVRDQHNKIFQYLSVRNLITVQKDYEEKLVRFQEVLLKREQQLKDAQEVAKTGSWHIDISSNSLEWSEETYRIFELPVTTPMTYELFLEKIHPDDRRMVDENWQAALKSGMYEVEHRIITPAGEKWVRERARLEFDPSFALKEAVGTIQDITEKKETQVILEESEDLYRNLFNNSPFVIGIMDKETLQFMEVNETATQLYGYSREEFMKLRAYDIRIAEEQAKLSFQVAEGKYKDDTSIRPHKKKNGEIILVEPTITEIVYREKPAFLITITDVTDKLRIQEELNNAKLYQQKAISRASLETQEKSRSEIGRELHDNINQLLVASTLYLNNINTTSDKDKMLLSTGTEIIATAIKEIRKLSSSFVPPSFEEITLKESIQEFSKSFNLADMSVDFDLQISEESMPEGLKINIYRIIQEQFNNIIKYAKATKVTIRLVQQQGSLILEITDNGKGFDQKQKVTGIGLKNILHRAEAYNGALHITSSPGNGCKIRVEFTSLK